MASWPDMVGQAMFGAPFPTPSLMLGWEVVSWRGQLSHPGCCQMPPLSWVWRWMTTGPRASYVQVCDYDFQWSPSLVTLPCSYHHRSWGKKKNTDWHIGCTNKPVWEFVFKVGSHCTGTIPLAHPQKSRSNGTTGCHDWRLCWLQWMTRSPSVLQHVLCTPWCIAELPFWQLNLTADFLWPIYQNSLHILGWANLSHPGF